MARYPNVVGPRFSGRVIARLESLGLRERGRIPPGVLDIVTSAVEGESFTMTVRSPEAPTDSRESTP